MVTVIFFSQRNPGKLHTQPSPQNIFCYKKKAKTEISIYFKLNQSNLSLLKQKIFKNGYSYIFSQRNPGK